MEKQTRNKRAHGINKQTQESTWREQGGTRTRQRNKHVTTQGRQTKKPNKDRTQTLQPLHSSLSSPSVSLHLPVYLSLSLSLYISLSPFLSFPLSPSLPTPPPPSLCLSPSLSPSFSLSFSFLLL